MTNAVSPAALQPALPAQESPTAIPGIIGAAEANQYAADWLALIERADAAELCHSLRAVDGQQVAFVSFPVQHIVELVSAGGVQHIEAKFLLKPDSAGQPRVTLGLFATDTKQNRVSSVYLANEYSTAVTAPAPALTAQPKTGPASHNEVANVLVNHWLQGWATNAATPTMFATPYGTLRGYSFEVGDFLSPLFQLTSFGQEEVRIHFVLHRYHATNGAGQEAPAQTLGLAVQVWSPTALSLGDLIWDMSRPCPPFSDPIGF